MTDTVSELQKRQHERNAEAIREAFANITCGQWEAGDAALREVPMGPHGGAPTGAEQKLRALADECGFEFDALDRYRTVSQWPEETRVLSLSWSVHRAAMSHPDREQFLRDLVAKYDGKVTVEIVRRERDALLPVYERMAEQNERAAREVSAFIENAAATSPTHAAARTTVKRKRTAWKTPARRGTSDSRWLDALEDWVDNWEKRAEYTEVHIPLFAAVLRLAARAAKDDDERRVVAAGWCVLDRADRDLAGELRDEWEHDRDLYMLVTG